MPKYLIERALPGAGNLSADELQVISRTSCDVLSTMADRAQWIESFVTDDAVFCVYLADGPETLRAHAEAGGFPVTAIHRVGTVIDPTTADAP